MFALPTTGGPPPAAVCGSGARGQGPPGDTGGRRRGRRGERDGDCGIFRGGPLWARSEEPSGYRRAAGEALARRHGLAPDRLAPAAQHRQFGPAVAGRKPCDRGVRLPFGPVPRPVPQFRGDPRQTPPASVDVPFGAGNRPRKRKSGSRPPTGGDPRARPFALPPRPGASLSAPRPQAEGKRAPPATAGGWGMQQAPMALQAMPRPAGPDPESGGYPASAAPNEIEAGKVEPRRLTGLRWTGPRRPPPVRGPPPRPGPACRARSPPRPAPPGSSAD